MPDSELEQFLKSSLSDRRLSGSERTVLAEWLKSHPPTPQDLGVIRHELFAAARDASASLDTAQILDWLEDTLKVVQPTATSPTPQASLASETQAYFSPGVACLNAIVGAFQAARRTADVCVFTITDDRITRSILAAHRRGLRIRIVTDNDKANDLGSDIAQLADAGLPVAVDQSAYHMHHKFAIFDDTTLLNGSYNWTRGAAEQNEENIVASTDATLVAAFRTEFDALWAKWFQHSTRSK